MKTHTRRELRNCNALKDSVRYIVEDRMPDLPDYAVLTAEKILGDFAWSMLGPGEPSLVGKCLKELVVDDGALDFDLVEGLHEYPLLYRKRISA